MQKNLKSIYFLLDHVSQSTKSGTTNHAVFYICGIDFIQVHSTYRIAFLIHAQHFIKKAALKLVVFKQKVQHALIVCVPHSPVKLIFIGIVLSSLVTNFNEPHRYIGNIELIIRFLT